MDKHCTKDIVPLELLAHFSSLQPRQALYHRHFSGLHHPMSQAVQTLLISSDYACRHIELLQELLQADDCLAPLTLTEYAQQLAAIVHQPISDFSRKIRQFRHYHFLRLLLREYQGAASTIESMRDWSDCADALILRTLEFCQREYASCYGRPYDASGKLAQLFVLAMGKLGGRELNYSSDIDLIMVFSGAGITDGPESVNNQHYFTRTVQLFIQLLQNVTENGFVFRVDLRLRPNGESGALVTSVTAMETYYQEQGRDWERYAMVKARLINASDEEQGSWFERLIVPFTYRRYVDFSAIESLRSMKSMIEREVALNPALNDIKRGLGGIREVEFIIQSFQLIRGGRLPSLRHQNTLRALHALQEEKILPHHVLLKKGYLFLRKLENCLQSENDQQTHRLPQDTITQMKIAFAMNFSSWEALITQLQQCQQAISAVFQSILKKVDYYEDDERIQSSQLMNLWQGHIETITAINLLESLGFQHAQRCYELVSHFHDSPRCRRLTQAARLRLDRFMVLLLAALIPIKEPELVLLNMIHLLENIVGRSAYLALLTENPPVLKQLLYWFAHCPFIMTLIINYPFLLEILLREDEHWQPSSRKILQQQLQAQLAHCHEEGLKEEVLRQFKLSQWLMTARAEINGDIDAIAAARFLSDVAQVLVKAVVALACQQLAERYPEIEELASEFAIIAYGKLGSQEMNYKSDLDLVFVHSSSREKEGLVIRLTQKIMHMLTTRLQFGILYQVDTRLRPSGEGGLLVSRLQAFIHYQKNQAWTWEHQALIRSRVIVGSPAMQRAVIQLKKEVFLRVRDREKIAQEIQEMRRKMKQNNDEMTIKLAPGGLVDLEFLVQFLILVNPGPQYHRYTHTLQLLRQLVAAQVLSREEFQTLEQIYRSYHAILHNYVLEPDKVTDWSMEQEKLVTLIDFLFIIAEDGQVSK